MVHKGYRADALIESALAAFKRDLADALPADKRYLGAMVVRALEIARRDMKEEIEAAEWKLLDPIYGEGDGTLSALARDIRSGEVSETKHIQLAAGLKALVAAELKIRNPAFLKSRKVKA